MLRFLLIIGFATLLLVAGVASAFEPGARRPVAPFREAMAQHRAEQPRPPGNFPGRVNNESRPEARPEGRPEARNAEENVPHPPIATPDRAAGGDQRPGHLSPDERAALRRQIDEAGRDVYRSPPRANRP